MALEQELKIVIATVDKSTPQLNNIASGLKGIGIAGAIVAATLSAGKFLGAAIKEASEMESSMKTLGSILENNGENFAALSEGINLYVNQLEKMTMYTDTQVVNGLRQLASFGMNAAESQQILVTAMDLATARGLDLNTTLNLLGKAYQGNTEQLKRYGITADDFGDAVEQLNKQFGGVSQKQMDTYEGQIKKLETAWKNFMKGIGEALTPAVTKALNFLNKLFGFEATAAFEKQATKLREQITYYSTLAAQMAENNPAAADVYIAKVKELEGELEKLIIAQAKTTGTGFGPVIGKPSKKQEEENKKALDTQFKDAEDYWNNRNALEDRMADRHAQIAMSKYEYDMALANQEFAEMEAMGVNEVVLEQYKSDRIKEIHNEALQFELAQYAQLAGAVGDTFSKIGVASGSTVLKGAGVVLKSAQTVIEGVSKMLLSTSWIGFALGLLGVIGGVADTAAYFRQLEDMKKENESLLTVKPITPTTTSTLGGGTTTTMTAPQVERAPSPTYNYITNTYNLNAGIILGEESVIDAAFKKIMTRYDASKALTLSGA